VCSAAAAVPAVFGGKQRLVARHVQVVLGIAGRLDASPLAHVLPVDCSRSLVRMMRAQVRGGGHREVAIDEGGHDLDHAHGRVRLASEDGLDRVAEVEVAVVCILEFVHGKVAAPPRQSPWRGCALGIRLTPLAVRRDSSSCTAVRPVATPVQSCRSIALAAQTSCP
jgi:hypothetical protein